MRYLWAILIAGMLGPQALLAQPTTSYEPDTLLSFFQFDDPSLLSCLYTYFPPLFIHHGMELKSFIRSKTFRQIRQRFGDARAVDAIYIRSMQMTNNNTAMALLISTIATFDHRLVGLKIPVFQLFFPLSNESFEDFERRVNNLPAHLYSDSPSTTTGDRDKLQHFFGSACVSFMFESRDAAERVGEFVEQGEDAFIVDGLLDDRDMRANREGQDFGIALLNDSRRIPSEFLKLQIASKKVSLQESISCTGVW